MSTAAALLDVLGPVGRDFDSARSAGARAFLAAGLPTRKLEDWRFTELRPLTTWRPTPAADLTALDRFLEAPMGESRGWGDLAEPSHPPGLPHRGGGDVAAAADVRLVLVDGRLDPGRSRLASLPNGVFLGSFNDWASAHPEEAQAVLSVDVRPAAALVALNAAAFTDGWVLTVPAGMRVTAPIHILHWSTGAAAQTRSLIRLGEGADAAVAEDYRGEGAGFTNASLTIELGGGSRLGWAVTQDQAKSAIHYAHSTVRIGAGARLDGFVLNLGAKLARTDLYPSLDGKGAHCGFSGATALGAQQDVTVAAIVTHTAPGCTTREVFKGCLADAAHGAFQGRIVVERAAQKTDAYQLCKTLLLGERAVMDAKPELEIHADDVKCSHGATVGDLDELALFYCRSRGIPAGEARAMLIQAFLADAVAEIPDAALREPVAAALYARLEAIGL